MMNLARPWPGSALDERSFQVVVDVINDGIILTSSHAASSTPQIVYANRGFTRIFGYEVDEVRGRSPQILHGPKTEPMVLERWMEAMLRGEPFSVEMTNYCKDGSERCIQWAVAPLRYPQGSIAQWVGQLRDVTQERMTYERYRMAERLATLGTFAAGIAHELRSPLNAALIAAETSLQLASASDTGRPMEHALENIIDSLKMCECIVKDFLRRSRNEPGNKIACDLNGIVERALKSVLMEAAQRSTSIDLELSNSLPSLVVDPLQIELVIVNVLRNAMQAGATTVHLSTVAKDDSVLLCVHDNGCGMSDDQVVRVFNPFYTTRLKAGGSGLGLSIVYGIVHDHHGQIAITSKAEGGTSITIDFPRVVSTES